MSARGPQYKMVLLGEVGVGKTALFFRLKDDIFSDSVHSTTVGIESCSRVVVLDRNLSSHVTFSVWDTAGVERFRTLTRNYYRSAHVSMLMYSVDNPVSLHYLPKWSDDARDFSPNSLKVLVGNKSDINSVLKENTAEDFASIYECDLSFVISAKTGHGVESMLEKIGRTLVAQNQKSVKQESNVELEKAKDNCSC